MLNRILKIFKPASASFKVILSWIIDFWSQLNNKNGWKLFAKVCGSVVLLLGFLNGYQLYYHQKNSQIYKSELEEFQKTKQLLESVNTRKRIEGIEKLPLFFTKYLPLTTPPSTSEIFFLILGIKSESSHSPFSKEVIEVLYNHFQGLSNQKEIDNSDEVIAIVRAIRDLSSKFNETDIDFVDKIHLKQEDYEASVAERLANISMCTKGNAEIQSMSLRNLINEVSWLWMLEVQGSKNLQNAMNKFFHSGDLRNIDLRRLNLSFGDFESTDFSGADLTYTSFSFADLNNTVFENSDLTSTDFRGSSGSPNFSGARLYDIKFSSRQTNLESSNFSHGRLLRTSFFDAILDSNDFSEASIYNVDFGCAYMQNSIFALAGCDKCNFNGADLKNSDLVDSVHNYSTFSETDLSWVNFSKSVFKNSTFYGSTLYYSDFSGAEFINSDIHVVENYYGSNFYNVKGLSDTNLEEMIKRGAIILCGTGWEQFLKDGRPVNWTIYEC
jgi:uncharacterized protein YjbI with pentapeptide repeats